MKQQQTNKYDDVSQKIVFLQQQYPRNRPKYRKRLSTSIEM